MWALDHWIAQTIECESFGILEQQQKHLFYSSERVPYCLHYNGGLFQSEKKILCGNCNFMSHNCGFISRNRSLICHKSNLFLVIVTLSQIWNANCKFIFKELNFTSPNYDIVVNFCSQKCNFIVILPYQIFLTYILQLVLNFL